jgi:hypothetical protein
MSIASLTDDLEPSNFRQIIRRALLDQARLAVW